MSFENFWKNSKNLLDSVNSPKIPTALATSIQQIIIPAGQLVFGFNDTQAQEERFSKEVANYVISDEFISSLSKDVGEPKTNETEEEFVKRASSVLKVILKKKFDV